MLNSKHDSPNSGSGRLSWEPDSHIKNCDLRGTYECVCLTLDNFWQETNFAQVLWRFPKSNLSCFDFERREAMHINTVVRVYKEIYFSVKDNCAMIMVNIMTEGKYEFPTYREQMRDCFPLTSRHCIIHSNETFSLF